MNHISPNRSERFKWGVFDQLDDDGALLAAHVVPLFGAEHLCTVKCWCHPERDITNLDVIIHNVAH